MAQIPYLLMTEAQRAALAAPEFLDSPLSPIDWRRPELIELAVRMYGVRRAAKAPCTLGVGCDETGRCYAEAMGQPSRCGREA